MKINDYIEMWYLRTLPVTDFDNGGIEIPPPSKDQWENAVRRDLDKITSQEKKKWKEEVLKIVGEDETKIYDLWMDEAYRQDASDQIARNKFRQQLREKVREM